MAEATPKSTARSSTSTPASSDAGQKQLQQAADEVAAKGYVGTVPDDDTDYTVAGVTKAAKTQQKKGDA
jgi:hypothetical protein